jgi:hypothetical protein
MCEGYTELSPLVAIFCTNMAVEKKSEVVVRASRSAD